MDAEADAITQVCQRLHDAVSAVSVVVWSAPPPSILATVGASGATSEPPPIVVPMRLGSDAVGEVHWRPHSVPPSPAHVWLATATADLLAPLVARVVAAPTPALTPTAFGLVGRSDAMGQLRAAIPRAAAAPFPILIEGESGVGKELVARAIHTASRRRGPFVAVNCAALSEDLLDAELFGHARGAFTGAAVERRGLFEEAQGGSFFLDEIAELSPRGQAKLLRVLQEGELRRLGENAARAIDIRLIAATNRPLHDEVRAGRFRADLRFRLDVVRLSVPPLRDRRDDVPVLAEHFWRVVTAHTGSRAQLAPSLLAALSAHDWPGNARELQNAVAALAVNAPARGLVRAGASLAPRPSAAPAPASLDAARRSFETAYVRAALARCGDRPTAAARELGVTRQGLAKLIGRLGLRGRGADGTLRPAS